MHFEPVLFDAWRRVPRRRFTAVLDAGYDGEQYHELARRDMGIRTIMPPLIGRPRKDGGPPGGYWRRRMKRLLRTKRSRRRCGYTQRWQSETVNSAMKRNLGSFCRGKTKSSRQRDLRLKALTHNLMIFRRRYRGSRQSSYWSLNPLCKAHGPAALHTCLGSLAYPV